MCVILLTKVLYSMMLSTDSKEEGPRLVHHETGDPLPFRKNKDMNRTMAMP